MPIFRFRRLYDFMVVIYKLREQARFDTIFLTAGKLLESIHVPFLQPYFIISTFLPMSSSLDSAFYHT